MAPPPEEGPAPAVPAAPPEVEPQTGEANPPAQQNGAEADQLVSQPGRFHRLALWFASAFTDNDAEDVPGDDPTFQQLLMLAGLFCGPVMFFIGGLLFWVIPHEHRRTKIWSLGNLLLSCLSVIYIVLTTNPNELPKLRKRGLHLLLPEDHLVVKGPTSVSIGNATYPAMAGLITQGQQNLTSWLWDMNYDIGNDMSSRFFSNSPGVKEAPYMSITGDSIRIIGVPDVAAASAKTKNILLAGTNFVEVSGDFSVRAGYVYYGLREYGLGVVPPVAGLSCGTDLQSCVTLSGDGGSDDDEEAPATKPLLSPHQALAALSAGEPAAALYLDCALAQRPADGTPVDMERVSLLQVWRRSGAEVDTSAQSFPQIQEAQLSLRATQPLFCRPAVALALPVRAPKGSSIGLRFVSLTGLDLTPEAPR